MNSYRSEAMANILTIITYAAVESIRLLKK